MAQSRQSGPSKWYLVSYPDPAARTLRMKILDAKLSAAEAGNTTEQGKICARYKHRLGLKGVFIDWKTLHANMKIDPNQSPPQKKHTALAQPQIYGCTCERDPECPGCDQGSHRGCRYNCKYGQRIR